VFVRCAVDSSPMFVAIPPSTIVVMPGRLSYTSRSVTWKAPQLCLVTANVGLGLLEGLDELRVLRRGRPRATYGVT